MIKSGFDVSLAILQAKLHLLPTWNLTFKKYRKYRNRTTETSIMLDRRCGHIRYQPNEVNRLMLAGKLSLRGLRRATNSLGPKTNKLCHIPFRYRARHVGFRMISIWK